MLYRSRSYSLRQKRRRTKRVIIIILAILAFFAGVVFLGNVLKHRAEDSKNSSTPIHPEITRSEGDAVPNSSAPAIKAFALSLGDLKGMTENEMREAAKAVTEPKPDESGVEKTAISYTGVAVMLTDGNGVPLFSLDSDSDGENSDGASLFDFVTAMHNEGLRTVGYADVNSFASDNDGMNLISAAWGYGLDEIVLFGFDLANGLTSEIEYLNKLKELSPGIFLGVSLPIENLKVGDSALESLVSAADFLGIEIGKPTDETACADYLDRVLTDSVSLFVRYSPRLVLSDADGYSAEDIFNVLTANSVDSWLIRSEGR